MYRRIAAYAGRDEQLCSVHATETVGKCGLDSRQLSLREIHGLRGQTFRSHHCP